MKKSDGTNATGAKNDGDVIPSVSTTRSKTTDEGSIDCSLECMRYETGHGLSRYKNALESLVPLRLRDNEKTASPVDSAGLFSSIFFTWMSPFMWKAYREGIAVDELPKASPYDTCEYNRQRMETLWELELSRRGPEEASFKRVAWRFVRTRIYASCFLFTCTMVLGFLSPTLLMRRLLLNVQSPDGTIADGVIFALLLTTSDLLRALFFAWTWATNYRTALRLRSACMALLYGKILRSNGIGGKSVGELINIFSNDCQRVFDVILVGPMLIGGPLVAALGIFYVLWLLSPLALSGMLVFFLFYPLQYMISRLIGHFRSRSVKVTDARIRTMSEILECAKLIKMSAWEEYFSREILDIRRREQELLLKVAYCRSLGMSLTPAVPVISAIVTFLAHLSSGSSLTAAEAFPVSTFFGNQMKQALTSIRDSTQNLIDAFIAFDRFKSILLLKEGERSSVQRPIVKFQSIAINHGTFARDYSDSPVARSETGTRVPYGCERQIEETIKLQTGERADRLVDVLFDISFEAKKGELIGICGHVGSGKSSLLLAILGQLRATTGCVARDGSCAYVSQQAWIVNGTFRENILFGERFDARRYNETLVACSLNRDLDALPEGELTEIGERGANLSGGQKQRVALARALYADRDIYLLDDPLSAVDAQVGARVFHDSILTFLKEKTVVFVTHSIKYLSRCGVVCVMREGRIATRGTHQELAQADGEYAAMVKVAVALEKSDDPPVESENSRGDSYPGTSGSRRHDEARRNSRDNRDAAVAAGIADNRGGEGKAISPASRASVQRLGAVKSETYRTYVRAAGGYFVAVAVLLTFLLNIGSTTFSTWWLAAWLNAGAGDANTDTANDDGVTTVSASGGIGDNPDFGYYRTVYGLCICAILATSLIRGFGMTRATLEAATTLHNGVFEKVMSCPVRFFDTTPSGRIQNLFSRDFDEVDNRLPLTLEGTIQNTCIMLFAVLSICVVFPWFSLPLIFLAALYYSIGRIFRVAIRDLRRLENESRSPIFSFVSVTVQGLSTIRAFEKEGNFAIKFQDLLNRNNSCLFLCNVAMRWLAVRFDCLAVTSTCITAFLVTFLKGRVSPALAGLALSYCAYIAGVFQYTVRLMAEVEMRFTSVEKIENYTKSLKSEKRVTIEKHDENEEPQKNWPSFGRIEFKDVRMRYGEGLPLALNGISFKVERGEKIGIVGRTGSGKSSLIAALFGLVDLDGGKIEIDGADVSRIDRKVLRSRLSVIPQDPVLFTGTVRSNLDPSGARADSEVWAALEKTRSKDKVLSMAARLDSPIGFSGNDLSQGERQLLCLSRALLRCSKILVLDEATAAVDPETEEAVQNTIQREFANCTVLTIAHRLRAVLACDRVLVMDAAKVLEFDTPANLLADESSKFARMMAAAR